MTVLLIGSWLEDNYLLLVAGCVYSAMSLFGRAMHKRIRHNRRTRDYIAALSIFAVRSALFRMMVIYVWIQPDVAFKVLALCLMIGAVQYSIAQLSRVPTFLLVTAILDSITFVILGGILLVTEDFSNEACTAALAFVGVICYHWICLRNSLAIQASLRAATAQSEQSRKLEAVGRLTGGVAHDFNNILTVILGNLDLYLVIEDPKEKDGVAEDARTAAKRGADLVAQLLAFSRKSQLVATLIYAPELIERVMHMAEHVLPATIQLEHIETKDVGAVYADPSQLESALLNLILNAKDAMPEGGKITLRAENVDLLAQNGVGASPGPFVRIDVSDEGTGIPDETISKVFDPFFTTKAVGEGSGLGLSTVKGFTEQSGGGILLRSEPGSGTLACIFLPRADLQKPMPVDRVETSPDDVPSALIHD